MLPLHTETQEDEEGFFLHMRVDDIHLPQLLCPRVSETSEADHSPLLQYRQQNRKPHSMYKTKQNKKNSANTVAYILFSTNIQPSCPIQIVDLNYVSS